MKGYHKVTVTVEIDEGATVLTSSAEFSGGNPIWHSTEFLEAVSIPVGNLKKAIEAVYGER